MKNSIIKLKNTRASKDIKITKSGNTMIKVYNDIIIVSGNTYNNKK